MTTLIDVAGHPTGGSARWRNEAKRWIDRQIDTDVELIGVDERVTPGWLVRRERIGRSSRRIAANNVSFLSGSGTRVVLLRNALHFLMPGEREQLPGIPRGVGAQTPIVHAAARRADHIVVPCTAMGDRVRTALPSASHRIFVRHHPLTVGIARQAERVDGFILYPCLPSPHKDLVGSLSMMVKTLEHEDLPFVVKVTASANDVGSLSSSPKVLMVGPQSLNDMDQLFESASAIYLPSQIESFGYPLAEARAIGVPAIAVDTAQNREIGGRAIFGYSNGSIDSLAQAISAASNAVIDPDPTPFDADSYFSWLTGLE